MLNFQNIRVRAYLQTAVISDEFLPLDAVLYYHLTREIMGEKLISKPGESNVREGANVTLPIRKWGPKNEAWFYACSFAQWPNSVVEDKTFYVKKFDLANTDFIDTKVKRVDNTRGQFKAYHVNIYYRHAIYVEWYCVADKQELQKLLNFCTHIGSKTTQGWGSVLKWEITDWPEDWSVRGQGNKLMRAVPLPDQQGRGLLYGIRPSYWNPRHQFVCKMPDLKNNNNNE